MLPQESRMLNALLGLPETNVHVEKRESELRLGLPHSGYLRASDN